MPCHIHIHWKSITVLYEIFESVLICLICLVLSSILSYTYWNLRTSKTPTHPNSSWRQNKIRSQCDNDLWIRERDSERARQRCSISDSHKVTITVFVWRFLRSDGWLSTTFSADTQAYSRLVLATLSYLTDLSECWIAVHRPMNLPDIHTQTHTGTCLYPIKDESFQKGKICHH